MARRIRRCPRCNRRYVTPEECCPVCIQEEENAKIDEQIRANPHCIHCGATVERGKLCRVCNSIVRRSHVFTAQEISETVKAGMSRVRKTLKILADKGVLVRKRINRVFYYENVRKGC